MRSAPATHAPDVPEQPTAVGRAAWVIALTQDVVHLAVRALRLLLARVPNGMAVNAILAVCATLSLLALLLIGAVAETDFGPYLQEVVAVGMAVPIIVVLPLATVVIRLVRELESEREQALETAELDEVTGLVNRRKLLSVILRDIALMRRLAKPMTVALIDIDDFKSVNDVHGHRTGDALLRAVADACQNAIRTSDVIGRWGGEEFVLQLPDTDQAGARVILERVREAIAAARVTDGQDRWVGRTASIGGVTLPPGHAAVSPVSAQWLVELADRAMYAAKVDGKNRVTLDPIGAPPSA